MLKNKLKLLFSSTLIVGATASIIGVSYYYNSQSNVFNSYYSAPTSSSTNDLIQSFFSASVNGAKLLYVPSYIFDEPLKQSLAVTESANSPQYHYFNKTGFLLLDSSYGFPSFNVANDGSVSLDSTQPIWSTNVSAVQFRADLGAFVTGIAAAQFLNENQDYFKDDKGKLTWDTYGGLPFPTVTCFMGGFEQGIKFFNEKIVPITTGYLPIERTSRPIGSESQNFAMTFESNGANTLIENILSYKPSLVLPVAGPQVPTVARLVKRSGLHTAVIGVDSAMEEDQTLNLDLPDLKSDQKIGNNKIIQFSVVKNLDVMIKKITNLINNGVTEPNNSDSENAYLAGLGYLSLGTLFNGGVGVSLAGQEFFANAISHLSTNKSLKYDEALKDSVLTNIFIDLDKPENKTYKNYSYDSIANSGSQMIPITSNTNTIKEWLKNYLNKDDTSVQPYLECILNWKKQNAETLQIRSQFNLKNQLNKSDYEDNNSVCKIIFQSPTSILFDNSFYQSCYNGLVEYWKTKGISLPVKK